MTTEFLRSPVSGSVKRIRTTQDDKIHVFVLTQDPGSGAAQLVASYFDDPAFDVKLTTVESETDDVEFERLVRVLRQADADKIGSVIVVKDSTVTNASPKRIAETTQLAAGLNLYDIVYLCRWQDKCEDLTNSHSLSGTSTRLFTTHSPNGTQALLITPAGRAKILGTADEADRFARIASVPLSDQFKQSIRLGNIRAGCVIPNILQFNIKDAKKPEDYIKTCECMFPSGAAPEMEEASFLREDLMVRKETKRTESQIANFLRGKNGRRHPGMIVFVVVILALLISAAIYLLVRRPELPKLPRFPKLLPPPATHSHSGKSGGSDWSDWNSNEEDLDLSEKEAGNNDWEQLQKVNSSDESSLTKAQKRSRRSQRRTQS
jgi:hypothetical protein